MFVHLPIHFKDFVNPQIVSSLISVNMLYSPKWQKEFENGNDVTINNVELLYMYPLLVDGDFL